MRGLSTLTRCLAHSGAAGEAEHKTWQDVARELLRARGVGVSKTAMFDGILHHAAIRARRLARRGFRVPLQMWQPEHSKRVGTGADSTVPCDTTRMTPPSARRLARENTSCPRLAYQPSRGHVVRHDKASQQQGADRIYQRLAASSRPRVRVRRARAQKLHRGGETYLGAMLKGASDAMPTK